MRRWLSDENQRVRMLLMPILDDEDPAEYVEKLQAELEAVAAAGQRDAALAISLYQDNQKLRAALDGTHLAFVHASGELQQAREALADILNLIDEHGDRIIKAHATQLLKARAALQEANG